MAESSDPDAQWFYAFLAGDPTAQREYEVIYRKRLIRLAQPMVGRIGGLRVAEDAVQQMVVMLFTGAGSRYDPRKGSVIAHLRKLLKTAARKILEDFTPPGQLTRAYKDENGDTIEPKAALSLNATVGHEPSGEAITFVDLLPDTSARPIEDTVADKLTVTDAIDGLRQISLGAARVARGMYLEGKTIGEAGDEIGISRFVVRRAFNKVQGLLIA